MLIISKTTHSTNILGIAYGGHVSNSAVNRLDIDRPCSSSTRLVFDCSVVCVLVWHWCGVLDILLIDWPKRKKSTNLTLNYFYHTQSGCFKIVVSLSFSPQGFFLFKERQSSKVSCWRGCAAHRSLLTLIRFGLESSFNNCSTLQQILAVWLDRGQLSRDHSPFSTSYLFLFYLSPLYRTSFHLPYEWRWKKGVKTFDSLLKGEKNVREKKMNVLYDE